MACRHANRLVRVRVSPSGQSRARPSLLSRVLSPSDKTKATTRWRRAEAGGCRLFLVRAACRGSRFPRKGRDAFPASFGLGRPRSERCRRSSPETTGRRRLPAGKPAAAPSLPPLRRAGSRAPSAPAPGGRQLTRHSRLRKEREDDEGEPRGRPCSPRGRSGHRASRARPRRGTAGARRTERPSPRPRR